MDGRDDALDSGGLLIDKSYFPVYRSLASRFWSTTAAASSIIITLFPLNHPHAYIHSTVEED